MTSTRVCSGPRRKRKTSWFGVECGAVLDEWTGQLALGAVTRNPELGITQFRPSCALAGAPGKALLTALMAIRLDTALTPLARAQAVDAAIRLERYAL